MKDSAGSIQRKAMWMASGLEERLYEQWLRALGFLGPSSGHTWGRWGIIPICGSITCPNTLTNCWLWLAQGSPPWPGTELEAISFVWCVFSPSASLCAVISYHPLLCIVVRAFCAQCEFCLNMCRMFIFHTACNQDRPTHCPCSVSSCKDLQHLQYWTVFKSFVITFKRTSFLRSLMFSL